MDVNNPTPASTSSSTNPTNADVPTAQIEFAVTSGGNPSIVSNVEDHPTSDSNSSSEMQSLSHHHHHTTTPTSTSEQDINVHPDPSSIHSSLLATPIMESEESNNTSRSSKRRFLQTILPEQTRRLQIHRDVTRKLLENFSVEELQRLIGVFIHSGQPLDVIVDRLKDVVRCAHRLMLHFTRLVCDEMRADLRRIHSDFNTNSEQLFIPYTHYAHEYTQSLHRYLQKYTKEALHELLKLLCSLHNVPINSSTGRRLKLHLVHGMNHFEKLLVRQFAEAMASVPGYEDYQETRDRLVIRQRARNAQSVSLRTFLDQLNLGGEESQESLTEGASGLALNEMRPVTESTSGLSNSSTVPAHEMIQTQSKPSESDAAANTNTITTTTNAAVEPTNQQILQILMQNVVEPRQQSRRLGSLKSPDCSANDLLSQIISKLLSDHQVQTLMQREIDQLATDIVNMCGPLAPHIELMLSNVFGSLTKLQIDLIQKIDSSCSLNLPLGILLTSLGAVAGLVAIALFKSDWLFDFEKCMTLTQPGILFVVFCAVVGASVAMITNSCWFNYYKR